MSREWPRPTPHGQKSAEPPPRREFIPKSLYIHDKCPPFFKEDACPHALAGRIQYRGPPGCTQPVSHLWRCAAREGTVVMSYHQTRVQLKWPAKTNRTRPGIRTLVLLPFYHGSGLGPHHMAKRAPSPRQDGSSYLNHCISMTEG